MENADLKVPPRRVARDVRRPFGAHMQKLAYEARPGFHRHWFNSTPGRIDDALAAGYTHVEDKEGRKVERIVGVGDGGIALVGYLMEIPLEWYQEDMVRQQAELDKTDNAIRQGAVAGTPGVDGRYIPTTRGISIKSGSGAGGR